ncbi:hypothetical protein HK405_010355 [Cladochytrium tenue]|nr:hypothetical protein HK405_010355 [Cladochytrium tenue]
MSASTKPTVVVKLADPRGEQARWCLEQYYTELQARFDGGFKVGQSRDPAPEAMEPPCGAFLMAFLHQGDDDNNNDSLTAATASEPLGCVGLKGSEARRLGLQADPLWAVAEVKRLWVSPAARGLGVGAALMVAAEGEARRLGVARLRLDTNRVLTEALAMYRRPGSGWVEIARFSDEQYADFFFEKQWRKKIFRKMDLNIEELLEAPFKKAEDEALALHSSRSAPDRSSHSRDEKTNGHGHGSTSSNRGGERRAADHGEDGDDGGGRRSKRHRSSSRSSRRRRSSRSASPRRGHRHRSSRSPDRRDHRERDGRSSRSNRERGDRSDRERERERERDRSERDRPSWKDSDRDRDRPRRSRSPEQAREKKRRGESRERRGPLTDAERDRRTVFIMQLAARIRSSDIANFFSAAGRVRDVRLITDRVTRKSKGVGYVEFYEEESVGPALAMTGQKLLGIPIIVQPTEAEKNRIAAEAEVAAAAAALDKAGAPGSIFNRLYVGSLHFSLTEDDIRELFEVYGPLEFVTLHKDESGRSKGFAFVGLSTDKASSYQMDQVGLAFMDDDDKQGIALSSHARVSLMAKLARAEDGLMVESNSSRPQTSSSRCVLLTNMFDPETETEPDWDKEIEEDVKSECAKFGKVVHGAVDKDSQIQASFIPDSSYNARFPEAAFL